MYLSLAVARISLPFYGKDNFEISIGLVDRGREAMTTES